jgi:hypothetical protein
MDFVALTRRGMVLSMKNTAGNVIAVGAHEV